MVKTSFRHLAQCCKDLNKTRRFYEELLGFTFTEARDSNREGTAKLLNMSWPFKLNLVFLQKDGFELELMDFPLHGTVPGHEWVTNREGLVFLSLGMAAKDIPELIAKVPEYGGKVLENTNLGGAVCIEDPDGAVLEMVGSD